MGIRAERSAEICNVNGMELRENAASGRAGMAGLRWLLLGPESRRVVRHRLQSMLFDPLILGLCHLRHARFRLTPDAKLAAYYQADIGAPCFSGNGDRAIAVTWKTKWIGEDRPILGAGSLEREALGREIAPPFRRLAAQIPEWGMRIQVWPFDLSFPQLVRISDPDYVNKLLTRTIALSQERKDDRYQVIAVRYRPGQRHVLRYDSVNTTEHKVRPMVFVKLYRNGEGRRLSEVTKSAADFLEEKHRNVTCLRPLAYLPDEDTVLYPVLRGSPLSEQFKRPREGVGHWLECAGQAVSNLHGALPALFDRLSPGGFEAEIEAVREKSHYFSVLLPEMNSIVETLLSRAEELYHRLPQEPPAFTHGDLKAEHFWTTSYGLTLMDFDMCCLGDPALDLGQFLADLRLCQDRHGQVGIEEAETRFLDAYMQAAPRSRLLRARLFEALELVRVAGRRISLTDPNWESRVERLVRCAADLLDSLERASR